jgi:hypothetical protein
VNPERLIERARARCAEHRGPGGYCRVCYLAELQAMLLEEHPELGAEGATALVAEWIAGEHGAWE